MDGCKSEKALEKQSSSETARLPLVSAENKNGATRQARIREVSSRYRSPTPPACTDPKRCPSPKPSRVSSASTLSTPKRATSVERKRPSRPSSPTSSSTPVQDSTKEDLLARKIVGNKLPESLWPSTMRSLTVSFQSDAFSLPISKREKPVSHASSDRTLRPSSNVAHRQAEIPAPRKSTPARKRSPLKGKHSSDQVENSKPVDNLRPRLVDQHRWPTRRSGIVSNSLNRSIDLVDKTAKFSSSSLSGAGTPSIRRLSLDGATKPLLKSTSDLLMQISRDDSSLQLQKLGSSISSDRLQLVNATARALSLPSPGIRPPSPSLSRGNSPSRSGVTAPSSRGPPSPVRLRQPSPSRQPQASTYVLSFIVDIKKGKKVANHMEDVHQLRMLYNRLLQWRYANARADAALRSQKVKTENRLYCIRRANADLWDSILEKRIVLQQLNLKLKLHSILNNQHAQLAYLGMWASIEKDHISSLTWAIQDLQASTIRIPVTGGTVGDVKSLKAAVCSAVNLMQAIGSSSCSVLSRMEEMNRLVSELADVAAEERAILDECDSFLGTIDALQVEEYSLRSHLVQLKQDWEQREGV